MKLVDLTFPADVSAELHNVPLKLSEGDFTGRVHKFSHDSMTGTYIDFPGHIAETDDGIDAENYPIEDLFQIPAWVIHLDRQDESGSVTSGELQSTLGDRLKNHSKVSAIIINALGTKRFDEITEHSVYFSVDAVDWLISCGVKLIVSDVYESKEDPQSVFLRFFRAGVSTVCYPINLHKLPAKVKLTVMFPRFEKITQLPCRIIAQTE